MPSVIGEPFIIFGDTKHHLPRQWVAPLFGDQARCVSEATPVVGVVMLKAHVFTTRGRERAVIEGEWNCNPKVGECHHYYLGQRRLS